MSFMKLSVLGLLIVVAVVSGDFLPSSNSFDFSMFGSYQSLSGRSLATTTREIIRVTKLFLVNAKTGLDIMPLYDGTKYDLTKIGTKHLTIRAETNDANGCGWVEFDLDSGMIIHTDLNSPFSLAGNDTSGKFFPSDSLLQLGSHTLKVTPIVYGGNLLDIPAEKMEVREKKNRTKSFKSCWSIKKYDGVPAQPLSSDPQPGESVLQSSILSSRANQVADSESTDSGGLLSSLASFLGGRLSGSGRKLNDPSASKAKPYTTEAYYRHRRTEIVTSETIDDGSLLITFYVSSRFSPMPPTPAPTPVTDVTETPASLFGTSSGTFQVWNKITLGFSGPATSEASSSERGLNGPLGTFKDFRLDVTFRHMGGTGLEVVVPGYYAVDGDAANSLNKLTDDGSVWLVHFVPSLAGDWYWTANFQIGDNCSLNGTCRSGGNFDGMSGNIFVDLQTEGDMAAMVSTDLRRKGRLQYVGTHYLKFIGSEENFIAMGPDAPENLLAYQDFDSTPNNGNLLKSYSSHQNDYVNGNPTWAGGKGTELVGAINYLASTGANTVTATTLTINGPDKNVYPLMDPTKSKTTYDVSKLSQWGVVFDHTERMGMALKLRFFDSASDDFFSSEEELKLYFREMIARFGHHLGMIYDLGEDLTDVLKIKKYADFIRSIDPYKSPIMVHALVDSQNSVYKQLLGYPTVDIVSVNSKDPSQIASFTSSWIAQSKSASKPWVVSTQEQASVAAAWLNLMSGGSGAQFSPASDPDGLGLQDFRTMANIFNQSSIVKNFFVSNDITSSSDLVSSIGSGFIKLSSSTTKKHVVYKLAGVSTGSIQVDLSGARSFILQWINPRTGVVSSTKMVSSGSSVSLIVPTIESDLDWVALLTCKVGC